MAALPVVMTPNMAREMARPIRVAKDASAYITIAGAAARAKDVFAMEMRCEQRGGQESIRRSLVFNILGSHLMESVWQQGLV
eukprot:1162112-Pelagomonas_calceolata.AAC.1